MWRPEGFKNPYTPELQPDGYWSNGGFTESLEAFEEGADAMLESLRKRDNALIFDGRYPIKIHLQEIGGGASFGTVLHEKGTLVFIPDSVTSGKTETY
jgi:hypothetical protein